MVPYCMIHFAKPLPETFGAIIAGVVLGFMSLATRSIWMGALLHIAVALTMDLAALGRRLS
jgi:membrane protease YdiL (CAAX protease family)